MTEPNEPQRPPTPLERALAAPVSTFIFLLCIAVFVMAERSGSTQDTATLIRFGANYRSGVWGGEWWRLFTSMFLHIGVVHLVWNIWAGFSWTAPFERVVGTARFIFLYLVSGLVGSAVSIIGHDAVSAGASGALFGVMGGITILMKHRLGGWRNLWNEPAQRRVLVTTALWLAIGPFVGFDSFAHLGGLLAGMALTSGFLPGGRNRLAFATFFCAVVIAAATRPLPKLHDGWVDGQALATAWEKHDWDKVVALTANPATLPDYAFVRGAALIEQGKLAEGEALLPTNAERPEDVVYLAQLHERAGALEKAARTLDAALESSPRNLTFTRAKYELLYRVNDLGKAAALADQLIGDHPGTPLAFGLMGRRLVSDGQPQEALESLRKAYDAEPEVWSSDLAMLLIAEGERDEAREVLKAAPQAPFLSCYLAMVEGDYAGAGKGCETLKGDDAPIREARAMQRLGLEKCDEAEALLTGLDTEVAKVLRAVCATRRGEKVTDGSEYLLAFLEFSRTNDVTLLGDYAERVKNSWLWPLLPEAARRALPR